MPAFLIQEYEKRLKTEYVKEQKILSFYNQFRDAQGQELKDKFWNPASSSRYAFEMYSWLANETFVSALEFEYLLPQIHNANGRINKKICFPDMDVFFSTAGNIYFIESKFLEYQNLGLKDLSQSYYENNKGPQSLLKRYHKSEKISTFLPQFIRHILEEIKNLRINDKDDWFYPKQEITHLVGIALYLFDNPPILNSIKSKETKLHFYNVVYRKDEDVSSEIIDFRRLFVNEAIETFRKMFETELDYQLIFSQDFLKELFDCSRDKELTKAYCSNKTVVEQLQQFEM